jgi:ComEC/Rec2-related protein
MFDKKLPFFLFLVFSVGFGLFIYNTTIVEVQEIAGDTAIQGRVYDTYEGRNDKKYSVLLKDIAYVGALAGDEDRNIIVYTDFEVKVGDIVEFTGYLEAFKYDPFDSFSMSHYYSQVNYTFETAEISGQKIIRESSLTPYEALFEKIKNSFISTMGEQAGEIATSLVFGYRQTFETFQNEAIINNKLATVFSLSGLHFAFIAIGIFYLCRLFRINRSISLIIPFVILLIYGCMTKFPPALYRILIAQIIVIIGNLRYKKSDPLILWGIVVIVSLIIQPLSIFEIGFQIAALSMLGVVTYGSFIKKLFGRSKNPLLQTTAYITSTSVSSNLFAGAAYINTFGSFGVYLTLGAIIVIPFVSLTYFLLMGATIISITFPFMQFLLKPFKLLVLGLGQMSTTLENMTFATIEPNSLAIYGVIYVLTMFLMSKYILVRPKYKIRILVTSLVLTVVLMLST